MNESAKKRVTEDLISKGIGLTNSNAQEDSTFKQGTAVLKGLQESEEKLAKLEQESTRNTSIEQTAADKALGVVLDTSLNLKQTVQADRKTAVETKRKLDSIIGETYSVYHSAQQDMRDDGKIIRKINDVSKRKQRESNDPNYEGFFSERFQTPEGYQFGMRVFLDGAGQGKGSHISVFIQLCRTDYDDVLVYPFKGHCSITLYDQNTNPARSKKEHYTIKFKSNNSSCFQKPSVEYNPENGVAKFVAHDFLGQHESMNASNEMKPVYLCDDVIVLGAEIKCCEPIYSDVDVDLTNRNFLAGDALEDHANNDDVPIDA